MKPLVFSVTSLEQLNDQLREKFSNENSFTVAFVFFSIVFSPAEIIKIFRKYKIEIFGASSGGEIANEKVLGNTITVMLMDMNPETFRIKIFSGIDKTSFQQGNEIGDWAKNIFIHPSVTIVSTGLSGVDGDELVKGFTSSIKGQVPFYGALAGNDLDTQKPTYVIGSANFYNNGIVAMVTDWDRIETHGITVCGWKGIGVAKTVTRSTGNRVFTIDDQPAMEVYQKYLNISSSSDIGYNAFGILLKREDDTYVMRGALNVLEDKSVLYNGTIPEGSQIRFCMSPGFEVIDRTLEKLKEFNQRFPSAEAILAFDCVARLMSLGSMVEQETKALQNFWHAPVAGFFSFGEFGINEKGNCDFHSYTLSAVLMKKK